MCRAHTGHGSGSCNCSKRFPRCTAVSSEAWAKLRDWASAAGRGRLLLSGSVAHASLKTAVLYGAMLEYFNFIINFVKTLLNAVRQSHARATGIHLFITI